MAGSYMDLNECAEFANENPVGYVATLEGDQPRVRAFLMWFADESGFYFHTGEPKNVCKQLRGNPKIEVCFSTEGHEKTMRVAGEVEFLDDAKLRARLIEERPFLKHLVKGPEDPALVIFRISHGEARFWTMEYNMREDEAPRASF
jgi:pyridoxamine 5'-phosphate oxidase